MKKKRLMILLSVLLIFTFALTGCGGDDVPELVIGQGADANSLDPHATNDQPSSRVSKQIYETLVVQNENMELKPGLAESWEQVDELNFRFHLKQGVKFHNGEPFTAHDVRFTFLRALESPQVSHIVGAIDPDSIIIEDDHTIIIGTKEPFAPLLAHLAHTATGILNEKAVNEFGDDYGQNPVGTGPFKFVKWESGDYIDLERFEDYHGTLAGVSGVRFRNLSDNTTRTIELETGGVHIAYDIQPSDLNRVDQHPDLYLLRDMNFATTYIGFNCEKGPYTDPRVRQAINYAIDTESIVRNVYQGMGHPSVGPLGPNVFAGHQGLEQYGYDVEKAKALMAEAGYADGFKTTIWTNDNQQRMDIAEIVQNQLREINIEVVPSVMEWGSYLDATSEGRHDMFILGWVTVTGDPDYGLYALFHSEQHGAAGNRTFYSNARVDELLDKARTTADPQVREALYLEAQEIIRDEAPWVFTWTGEDAAGVNKKVSGFVQHPAGHHNLVNVRVAD